MQMGASTKGHVSLAADCNEKNEHIKTGVFTAEAIAEAGYLAKHKWSKTPRLNFESKAQVRALRWLMPLIGYLTSPAKKFGLKPKRLKIGAPSDFVTIRLIEPPKKPIGVVVDIHGGAWTALAAINDDPLTVPIANDGFVVISVDYRLVPEHRLEDAIQDCSQALEWALNGACARYEVQHVFLHGDSAGAHLALCAAIKTKRHPFFHRLSGLVLFFGAYDLSGTRSVQTADSTTMMLNGPSLLPLFRRVAGINHKSNLRNPLISPLYSDHVGLPPCLLIAGTNDPLIDDSSLLADALSTVGTPVEFLKVPEAPHAFNRFPIKLADEVNNHARRWMLSHING
jgi:acetyl esterase/lipase